ncbi:MAG: transposase [Planctomycetes bacterium]|nr:transposase [Planctomycetota bacterium]
MKRHNHPNHARFITFSTYQRLPLFGNALLKDEFVKQLLVTRERHPFLLHAWVLMPNHVHMLVRFPATGTPSRCSEP